MHQMFPLVRRRTLSVLQLQLNWTRSVFHKSARGDKNQNFDRPAQSEREVSSDPFGLDYVGLDTLVQGLYSNSDDNVQIVSKSRDSDSADVENPGIKTDTIENKSTEKVSVTDKYKDWFLEKKPNTIGPDSELIRTSDFGFIRFDKDNAARVQDNDYDNYEENQRREIPIATKRHQNVQIQHSPTLPVTTKDQSSKPKPKAMNTTVIAKLASMRQENPVPSIVTTKLTPKANADLNAPTLAEVRDNDYDNYEDNERRELPIATKGHQNIQPSPPSPVTTKAQSSKPNAMNTTKGQSSKPNATNTTVAVKLASKRQEIPVPSIVSAKLTPKANADPNAPVLAEVKVERVPRIYEIQDYNKITHTDMWNIIKHSVVYQNDFLIAINKPYGVPIHSPSVECRHTLIAFLGELAELGKCEKVYPLHRLDKDATGVLLFAKTEQAADIIKKKFKERQVEKKYITITKTPPHLEHGVIKIPISEGKIGGTSDYRSTLKPDLREFNISTKQSFSREAITNFKVLNSNEDCAFLEINTETGVKHQIRVHLAMGLGCPILGDHKYSHREKLAPQRLSSGILNRLKVSQTQVRRLPLHLHCSHVRFTMPDGFSSNSEPVFVTARPPHFFMHTLRKLYLIKGT